MKDFIVNIKEVDHISTKDKVHFALQFSYLFAIRFTLILLGFVLVPIGLLFKVKDYSKPTDITIDGKTYKYPYTVRMPKWLWLYGNEEEGISSNYSPWGGKHGSRAITSNWVMFLWAAIRNPVNNFRFTKLGQCDMTRCKHEVCKGENWYYAKSTHVDTGRVYFSFRWRKWYYYKGQNVSSIIHLGFKVLDSTVAIYINNPELFEQPHHKFRGWAVQAIPMRGYVKEAVFQGPRRLWSDGLQDQSSEARKARLKAGQCPVHGQAMLQSDVWYRPKNGQRYTFVSCMHPSCMVEVICNDSYTEFKLVKDWSFLLGQNKFGKASILVLPTKEKL